jgi:hypothetical protein
MRFLLSTCFFLLIGDYCFSQDTTKSTITVSGYGELYYSFDFNNPLSNTKSNFIYNYNRNNEVNANVAFIKAAYLSSVIRANISLASGTYMQANYTLEPNAFKYLYEANVGIKISSKNNLWIDAGIFASHIGFESAIGKDCWNLTRSLLADNSPYYESGIKLSYTSKNEKWFFSALLLNGWQHIQRVYASTTPSFGTQVTYTPSSKLTLNSSTFIGSDFPDSLRKWRYFHNFYGIVELTKKIALTIGFDCGMQQKIKASQQMNFWYSPLIIGRLKVNEQNIIAIRTEYYCDKNGVIIPTNTLNGFKIFSVSINYDKKIANNVLWRIEYRYFNSRDNVFLNNENHYLNNDTNITTALCIAF